MTSVPRGVLAVSTLMIIFGVLEVATAFSHSFLGISTSQEWTFTISGASIGILYSIAGLSLLTMKRRGAEAALVLLGVDVVGRLTLVGTGLYPVNSAENDAGIIGGTAIAIIFGVYIWRRLADFRA